ncbi:glycosyltransferase family 2 protein [Plantibacter sp. CFBP 8804]|nr:glycosyltransferase family 2 protein [Plantibacter sp. CFBP 8804]
MNPTDKRVREGDRPLGVLIVNYFSNGSVGTLVRGLAAQAGAQGLALAIVDNSCNSAEFAQLQTLRSIDSFASIRIDAAPHNMGYAGGNNRARNLLGNDLSGILILNPDVIVSVGDVYCACLAALRTGHRVWAAETATDAGALLTGTARLDLVTGRSHQLRNGDPISDSTRSLYYAGGHFFLTSVSLWDAGAGLSEDFFLYGEEADFFLRHGIEGDEIGMVAGLRIEHASGLTTGSQSGRRSKTTLHHATRSSIVLFRKHDRLRKFLLTVIVSRLMWALKMAWSAGLHAGFDVLAGLASGLKWKKSDFIQTADAVEVD